MKHLFSVICLLTTVSLQNTQAQIVKRIHLSGGNEVNIPITVIDSARVIDQQGERQLRIYQQSGNDVSIALSQIDSITHLPAEELSLEPTQLGELVLTSVVGTVRNSEGEPVFGARVKAGFGAEEVFTDNNGVFFLNDIIVYDRLGYITITKEGYHETSRSFLPMQSGPNRVNIQLLPMALSGNFSSTSGGTVSSGLLQLDFPADAVTLNGQAYTGTVNVYAAALDPSSPEMFDQMPGELLGGMNDSLQLLRSFGMANVELRDANMNELQLAFGSSVTLTFDIPSSLQADAPETIDWWSFDEIQGIWMHEGEALRQGNTYVGQASHFSWWNCDVPENFNDLNGSVNTVDGTPISDAQINVVTPTMGTGITYTNAEGLFSGRVPKNQLLSLNIYLTCETTNDWNLVYAEEILSATEPIVSQYQPASLEGRYPITGTLTNCEGQAAENGYVKIGSVIHLTNNGEFSIQTCATGEHSLQAFDTSNPDTIKVSDVISVQVESSGAEAGSIEACSEIYGSVTDIDGNVYSTVLIGEQWWMSENLKTARFGDGSEIPNVTNDAAWLTLSTPAWCNYENYPANDITYGKLYNWFTVSDPRNVCPAGWHVPTDAEWAVLTDYLGGQDVAGGKMKTTSGWQSPNTGATDESRFSGLPGGLRYGDSDGFINIGYFGTWWSSSESSAPNAWGRYLAYSDDDAGRSNANKRAGYSVRCLRD
jgi:uncharacterized protein (TIGR02145 family)